MKYFIILSNNFTTFTNNYWNISVLALFYSVPIVCGDVYDKNLILKHKIKLILNWKLKFRLILAENHNGKLSVNRKLSE